MHTFFAKQRTASTLQYFSHHCTIYYRNSGKATVFAQHSFFYKAHVLSNTKWMLLVLKQSVLTLKYSSGWLLLHVVEYILFPSISWIQRENVRLRKKIEIRYKKFTILKKRMVIKVPLIIKKKKYTYRWNRIMAQKHHV